MAAAWRPPLLLLLLLMMQAIDGLQRASFGCVRSALKASVPRMSWSDPEWNFGSANGKAHAAATRLRAALSTPAEREEFLATLLRATASWEDAKTVLALKCQRASKRCFASEHDLDAEDQLAWRALMNEMVECRFEGYRGELGLADAIAERLTLTERMRLSGTV